MAQRETRDINDFIDDYEETSRDYSEMGPLWAEMVFPDDFEALKALYGRNYSSRDDDDNDERECKRRR